MKRPKGSTRREFARKVVLAAAAPLGLSGSVAAEEQAKPGRPAFMDIAEAQLSIVQSRFGKFLTQEQLKEVATEILRGQYSADALKKVKLKNSDEPAFAFRADLP
jgi:hypothetical protein